MRRALVFILLGPALIALVVLTALFAAAGPLGLVGLLIIATIPLGWILSAFILASVITGLTDWCLSRALPIVWRAPLTAVIGAAIAGGLTLALRKTNFPPLALTQGVVNDALWAGVFALLPMDVCSLLAHNHREKPVNRTSVRSSLS